MSTTSTLRTCQDNAAISAGYTIVPNRPHYICNSIVRRDGDKLVEIPPCPAELVHLYSKPDSGLFGPCDVCGNVPCVRKV